MPPYHVETVASVLKAMLPTLVTVTTQPLMGSTVIKVSSITDKLSVVISYKCRDLIQ